MTQVFNLSEMVDEMKPTWTEFIVSLGYTEEQAKLFAEGYAAKVATLPTIMDKLDALNRMHDPCMTAGFVNAGIDEDEAHAKFHAN